MKKNSGFWLPLLALMLLVAAIAFFVWYNGRKAAETGQSSQPSVEAMDLRKENQKVVKEKEDGQSEEPSVEEGLADVWLELPADKMKGDDIHRVTHRAMMNGSLQRNYSYCYDEDYYTSYWVAYPLCTSHISSGREEFWAYDDKVDIVDQTDVRRGYGVSLSTENYQRNFYARGHQIPNADRSAVAQMQAQTYFSTNMTPQLQNGFNGGIWAKLEAAVRNQVPQTDTLYVITGASFGKSGQEEKIKTIVNRNDSKSLSVPNYYWKAILKVHRQSDGSISDASAIGFWLPHKDLKGHTYEEFAVSADSIEAWTGLNWLELILCSTG